MACESSEQFSSAFEAALKHTLGVEGEYSDHPADSGGATRWGITEETARAFGYQGPMSELPIGLARRIYQEQYWAPLQLDAVADLSPDVASEIFDSGVNVGTWRVTEWLQRLLNVLNRGGRDYGDIAVDGLMGPATLGALESYHRFRGQGGMKVLRRYLNALQGSYYVHLAERREKDEAFVFGWGRTRL